MKSFEEMKEQGGGYWGDDILDFFYLKNHYFPTKEMYDILKKELQRLCGNYPSSQKVIAKKLSKWEESHYREYINEDNFIVGNGSSELIRFMNSTIKKVTIPVPTFNEYLKLPKERINLFYPEEEKRFKIDIVELIKSAKRSKSDFVVLVNPNNPVGNIIEREEIEKILNTGIKVIVDEAFIDFSKKETIQDLVRDYNNLIVILSCTKATGLSGLRLGFILTTNKTIKEKIRKMLPKWNVNSISERFIELFLDFKMEYWTSIGKTIEDKNYLFRELKEINYFEPFESQANFILCKTKMSAKAIAEDLYYYHKIFLRDGLIQDFLNNSDSYLRIAVKTKEDNDKLILALKEIYGVK